jgi:VanZ family protein
MHYRTIWLSLGILYISFILIVSLIKMPATEISISHIDKIVHFLLYFILVGWFTQLYRSTKLYLFILLAAISLGLSIEYLQGMTAYRSFDWLDALANSIGAGCAFLLAKTELNNLLLYIDKWFYYFLSRFNRSNTFPP